MGEAGSGHDSELEALHQFLDACPVGLVSFRDDGRIERINPRAESLLAPSRGVVGPDNVIEVLGAMWPTLGQLVAAPTPPGLVVEDHRMPVGEVDPNRWLSATLVRVAADQWMMVLTDVSNQVAEEAGVRDAEERLRTVFESIDEGFCLCEMIVDDLGAPVDYRFLEVNPLFSEMTGLVDPVGRTALELVPGLESIWVETYGRVGLGRETIRFEQGSDEMGRWFDVFAVPVEPMGHFAIVFKDETRRRQAQATIETAAREAMLRAELADILRTLDDPTAIETEAARALGVHLAATRVQYAEIEPSGEFAVVRAEYRLDHLPTIVGRHRLDDYGPFVMNAIRSGETACVDDVETDDHLADSHRAAARALDIAALVMAPVTHDGQVRAAIVVHSATARSWTVSERALIEETAERTFAAINRARWDEALRVRHGRADAITKLITALELAPSLEQQANLVVGAMVELLGDYATLEAPGDDSSVLALAHRQHDMVEVLRLLRQHAIDEAAAGSMHRAANGENQLLSPITPALISEWALAPEVDELLAALGPRSHMAVPVSLGRQHHGALMVGITDPARELFAAEDLDFLRSAADRIGVVLAATDLRRQEHQIAIRLQQALLADDLLWHPNVDIEARYTAATADLEVGGDWYDTYGWSGGLIGLLVGDVVGHNLDSAAAMGRLRSAAAALAPHSDASPAAMLDALDDFARGRNGTDFATAACLVIDPATGSLTYSSAGHPPAIVVSPQGHCQLLDEGQSLPLCVGADRGIRSETSLVLEPNSLVVMYTDGLIERRRQPVDVGIDALQRTIVDLRDERLDDIAEQIIERMQVAPFEDDVVVVCFRYTPVLASFQRTLSDGQQLAPCSEELRAWLGQRDVEGQAMVDALRAVDLRVSHALDQTRGSELGHVVAVDVADHHHHLAVDVTSRPDRPLTSDAAATGDQRSNLVKTAFHRQGRGGIHGGTSTPIIVPTLRRRTSTAGSGPAPSRRA